MDDLSKKKCIACDGNIPPFDTSEIHKYLRRVDGWHVKSNDDKSHYLIKEFKFTNFEESQNFVNKNSNMVKRYPFCTSRRQLVSGGIESSADHNLNLVRHA